MGLQVFRVTGLIRFKVYRAVFGFTGLIGLMQFIGFTGFRVEYLWVFGLVSMSLGCRALDFKVYAAHTVLRLHRLSGLFWLCRRFGASGESVCRSLSLVFWVSLQLGVQAGICARVPERDGSILKPET